MDDKKFNRWFSAFILIGMSVALVLTTAIKLGRQPDGHGLLLLAAFGSLMGVLATVCSANGRIITFLFGLLDVAIYGAMCLMNWRDGGSGLGNAVLHFVYFVPMQFVGFAQWRRRGSNDTGQVKARRLGGRQWVWLSLAFLASTVVLYFVIARFDKSAAEGFLKMAVVLDVLPLVCNIFGQALMSTAYREQWFFWIGVNVFSIWMWARALSTGGGSYAVIYIIKYSFYLINSLNGLRIWHKLSAPTATKVVTFIATFALGLTLSAQPSGRSGFNEGWEFTLEGEAPRVVNLPHDWGVEKEFDLSYPSDSGRLPWWGRAVYRKNLPATPEDLKGRVFLDIDGAMAYASVRCNGKDLGGWPYGYASWRVELTPALREGDNELEVLIDNKEESSRWYPGGGLYRNVWITRSPKTGIAHWGTSVTVDVPVSDTARVWFRTTLSSTESPCPGTLETSIYLAGRLVASSSERIGAIRDSLEVLQAFVIPAPERWSPEQPTLYEAVTTVRTASGEDAVKTRFGIRDARFTPDGFFLNGEKTPIKGVCLHHDAGALGAAWNDDAWTRRLEMLKRMGCNAIRSSHNPPAPELLDLCDSMGFLVMDELTDMWSVPKKPNGYATVFDEWGEKDMAALIRRDRNHPSVILWSIGNEVLEQLYPEKWYIADTLTAICHRLDPTRPTILCCDKLESSTRPWHEKADIYGFNYKPFAYSTFHQANPDQPYMGSETASCVSTRGVYVFPVSEDKAEGRVGFQVSSYDYYAPRWASSPEYEWKYEDAEPSVCGEFVWTGYDYLGEPTPFNSDMTELFNFHDPAERAAAEAQLKATGRITPPSRSSYFGIIDLAGFPKDRYYAYQARWNPDLPMAHILPHWTWPGREGEVTPVHVYTSGDSAELFVNGKSQGIRRKDGGYRLRWDDVVYQEGSLKVVAYKDGRKWATDRVRTAGKARKVKLKKDYAGQDLLFVTAVVTDRRGETVPDASQVLTFSVRGAGEIVATDSGDPTSLQGFRHDSIQAFHGLSSVIVRRTGKGPIRVRVSSDGLAGSRIRL